MKKHTRKLAHAAIIAALYAVLTHFQNILLPGSATWAIQLRMSEALSILAFFTPAAAVGLAVGCLIFNLTFAAALPLDFLLGTLATYFAAKVMWWTRNITFRKLPLIGMLMPALFNAILVGWELTVYIGGGFWLNAFYVALGELIVSYMIVYRNKSEFSAPVEQIRSLILRNYAQLDFALDEAVMQEDVKAYRSMGFESITSFGCYLGADYRELWGEPPVKRYGEILLTK